MARPIKKLLNTKKIPTLNMRGINDISDLLLKNNPEYSSESEAGDLPDSKVVLPQDY